MQPRFARSRKKKNLKSAFDTDVPLPPLGREHKAAPTQATVAPSDPTPQTSAAQTTPTPAVQTPPSPVAPMPQTSAASPAQAVNIEPERAINSQSQPPADSQTPQPAVAPMPTADKMPPAAPTPAADIQPQSINAAARPSTVVNLVSPLSGISGRSLSEIMNGKEDVPTAEKEEITAPVDEQAQEKIEHFREKFVGKLASERPRLGVVYETMEVEGNTVKVKVASKTLHDEVLRHRTETLSLLAAVAGVNGPIELEVTVDETMKASKPIKIEDKVQYLAEKNPLFTDLRRKLDMEIE